MPCFIKNITTDAINKEAGNVIDSLVSGTAWMISMKSFIDLSNMIFFVSIFLTISLKCTCFLLSENNLYVTHL